MCNFDITIPKTSHTGDTFLPNEKKVLKHEIDYTNKKSLCERNLISTFTYVMLFFGE